MTAPLDIAELERLAKAVPDRALAEVRAQLPKEPTEDERGPLPYDTEPTDG